MSENPIRILLVEDDEIDRLAFLRHIEKTRLPYECKAVGSVAATRAIPPSQKFDVVVLDHNLGDGTGFDLLLDFPDTPVIFVTGSESPEVAVKAMKLGASDYLLKDHDRNYLKLMPVSVERALRQRRDREQLAESQELFRQSFSEAPIGIAFIAPGGAFFRVNRALCEMLGLGEQELLAGGISLLFQPDQARQEIEKLFPGSGSGSAPRRQRSEIRGRHKQGHEVWVQIDVARVPDVRGEGVTYVAQIQDITGQRRAEAEKRQAEEVRARLEAQLFQSQKMEALGSLAGGVAHEFNNMLGAIIGYTELAKIELELQPDIAAHLDEVLKASQRAKDLIQQVLTFSRRQDLKRELIHMQRLVPETLKLMRPGIPDSVLVRIDLAGDCPPIFGNLTQVQQALTNLFTNSRDAMQDGGGSVVVTQKTITLHRDFSGSQLVLPEGRYSVLSVTDSGHGMDAATLDRVFEPFFTTKGPGKGSGLGMAVVHGIMKSHDGAVTVQSELGKGTTVNLYFPLHESTAEPKPAPAKPAIPSGHGERILFVDDEPALVLIATRILQRMGYQVTSFTSAEEAAAAFTKQPDAFDLVITDLTMPGMTGMALADALLSVRADIPIVLATGYVEESVRDQAHLLGFREILGKPLSSQALGEVVQRLAKKK